MPTSRVQNEREENSGKLPVAIIAQKEQLVQKGLQGKWQRISGNGKQNKLARLGQ